MTTFETNKTVERLLKHPKVRAARLEDEDGYWVDLKPGWMCPASGSHSCHEDTAKAILSAVANAEPCDCEECEYRILLDLGAPREFVQWAECRPVSEILRDCPRLEWVVWLGDNAEAIKAFVEAP